MTSFMLTLVRHGQTEFNRENIIQGHLNVSLSDVGKQQATLLGYRLQNEMFSHVYSSDLVRAIETTRSILKQNHTSSCTVIEDCLLRERKFGIMEGKPIKCLKAAASKANMQVKLFTPLEGETLQQVHERAVTFFLQLCKQFLDTGTPDNGHCSKDTLTNKMVQIQCPSARGCRKVVPAETLKPCDVACSNFVSPASAELVVNESGFDKPKLENSSKFLSQQQLLDALNSLNDNTCLNEGMVTVTPASSKSLNDIDSSVLSANVLIVSHGGLLSELVCYLVEICGCTLPGGPRQALKRAPNGSFSKFIINVKNDSVPEVKCLHFHDRQHLDQIHNNSEEKSV